MDNSSKNKADDGEDEHLQLQLQQQWRRQSSNFRAPEERPYRRRIKPPPAKVHHVHPARFRRFVQRHTCCSVLPQPNAPPFGHSSDDAAASPTTSAATNLLLEVDASVGGSGRATDDEGCLDITRRSMQEAYMAWCSSNDVLLSPGTMAELSFAEHPSSHQR